MTLTATPLLALLVILSRIISRCRLFDKKCIKGIEKKNTYQRFKYIARRNHFYKALFYTLVLPIITSFLLLPFFLERTYTHTHTRTQERICFSFLPMYFCSKNLQCMSGFISSILLHIFFPTGRHSSLQLCEASVKHKNCIFFRKPLSWDWHGCLLNASSGCWRKQRCWWYRKTCSSTHLHCVVLKLLPLFLFLFPPHTDARFRWPWIVPSDMPAPHTKKRKLYHNFSSHTHTRHVQS